MISRFELKPALASECMLKWFGNARRSWCYDGLALLCCLLIPPPYQAHSPSPIMAPQNPSPDSPLLALNTHKQSGWRRRNEKSLQCRRAHAIERGVFASETNDPKKPFIEVPKEVFQEAKHLIKGKTLKTIREIQVGRPFHSTRLASLGAFRNNQTSPEQLDADLKIAKLQNQANHGSRPIRQKQKTAWADIVDDRSPGPIVQAPPSIADQLHTALSNGEVTRISTGTLKNTMLQYELLTHEVTEWQKWWCEQCCYISPFLAGEYPSPVAPETDDHPIEADALHPETPPKPDAENSNPDHIAHALEDQSSSINDTKPKIQELEAKTSSLESKIKSLTEAITDMSQELINPPDLPELGICSQSANNPHPSDKPTTAKLVPDGFGTHAKTAMLIAQDFSGEPIPLPPNKASKNADYSKFDQLSDNESSESSADERYLNELLYRNPTGYLDFDSLDEINFQNQNSPNAAQTIQRFWGSNAQRSMTTATSYFSNSSPNHPRQP